MSARFSIVTTTFNEYELTRQLVESVLTNIDRSTFDKLIIADDFSKKDGKLRPYLEYLQSNYDFIECILHDEHFDSIYNEWTKTTPAGSNWGPVVNLMHGVERVETEFSLNVDSDTIFLKKSKNLLTEMANRFDQNPNVVIMGQVMGDKTPYKVFTDPGKYWNDNDKIGSPSPMANAVRMSLIKERGIDYVFLGHPRDKAIRAGWNTSFLMRGIFEANLHTMNFPLFSEPFMVHIGGGTVDQHVVGRMMRKFAYCTDFEGRYGGKGGGDKAISIIDWYSGRVMINKKHDEYVAYLRNLYNRPYNDVREFDESIIKVVD
ncbi:MAG: glycosyltransferase family 2 protein [Candidatus Shapirobacteria bacterium]